VKVKAPEQQAALTFTKMTMSDQSLAINGAGDERVAAIIREMAPSYGVPTWFALRIANVESGFNPYARGRAGEIGVYQLKCQTARGMGFEGNCSALTDARTNVRWGLKHLSLAITSSGGNLKLAASKHNGGLGRKSLVHSYIAKVF
jgi:soluble lytic murein transglycosylase-like protein